MFGLNEFQFSGTAPRAPLPALKEPRVAAWYHRQCAWCLRLKHQDGTPHGHPWPRFPFYSHGICSSCKARLQARQSCLNTLPAMSILASLAPDSAAA